MKTKWIVILTCLCAAYSAATLASPDEKDKKHKAKDTAKADKAKEPVKASDFTLKDLDGKTHALKDLKGKIVVLEWTNKDCPAWRGRLDVLKKTAETYRKKGVVWLHIDSTFKQDEAASKEYMQSNKVTDPVLVDRDGKVGHAYDARTTPHMFVINKDGMIAYDGAIDDDQRGEKEKPTNYVAKALDEILAGKTVTHARTTPYGCSVKYKKA